ncbi:MAG: family 1 encapsulin nanocompartment shell protein [Solirubrobacteraceae bacterium]
MSSHLLRDHAPLSDSNWRLLDEEAKQRLSVALAARRLVDFSGPHGWSHSGTNLGRAEPLSGAPCDGVSARRRQVLALVESRAEFELSRAELCDDDRGAPDVDLAPLDRAAHQIAVAENRAVFHGWPEAGITGIAQASPHHGLQLGGDPAGYPRPVAGAVERLLHSGIAGPYAIALGSDEYRRVVQTAENGGYPLLEHLRKIVQGELVWAPGLDGALVISLRGEDFLFESGQDLSIGYSDHDGQAVRLYLEQSFSFRVATAEAAVPLAP